MKKLTFLLFILCASIFNAIAQEQTKFTQEEVIYARKDGMALTMLVLKPKKTNGKAVVSVVSGNWFSSYASATRGINNSSPFLESGYTVFLTIHGSNPRYDIAEAVADIKHAVQYIRYNAEKLEIDPDFIGITGGSSGGHLSLVVSTSDDIINPASNNPIRRVSSKVQAVAVFYPPTDFLNWGQPKAYMNYLQYAPALAQSRVLGALKFRVYDSINSVYAPIKDSLALRKMSISVSPAHLVSSDDAPTYIIHGDSDRTVPLQQSQVLKNKYDSISLPLSLNIKAGADHGWDNMNNDRKEFVKWFDKYLFSEK